MKRTMLRLTILCLLAGLLAGCGSFAFQPGSVAGNPNVEAEVIEPVTLQAGYIPIGPYLPFYVAIAKGYFKEQGLNVELQSFRTGAEMVAPLSLGQLDFGSGEVGTAFYNAVHQDLDIRAVLSQSFLTNESSYLPLVVRKDLFDSGELDSLTDLRGKKVAINNARGLTEWVAASALEAGGWTADDAELVVIPFPEMAQALQNQAVDAAWIQYPLAGVVVESGPNGEPPIGVRLIGGNEVTDEPMTAAVYFGKRLLAPENREIAVRVCTALIQAFRYINTADWRADEDLIALMSELTQTTPEAIRAGLYPGYDLNGRMKIESLADQQAYYVSRGYTEYTEVIPMDQVIAESFWKEALERIGEVQP